MKQHKSSIIGEAFLYIGINGLLYGAGFGAVVGALFIPTIRLDGALALAFVGAIVGAFVGAPLGCISGTLLGLITAIFFNPVDNILRFRLTVSITGSLIAFVGIYSSFALLFKSGDPTLGLYFALVLALIAAICSLYVSSTYAKHYLNSNK